MVERGIKARLYIHTIVYKIMSVHVIFGIELFAYFTLDKKNCSRTLIQNGWEEKETKEA